MTARRKKAIDMNTMTYPNKNSLDLANSAMREMKKFEEGISDQMRDIRTYLEWIVQEAHVAKYYIWKWKAYEGWKDGIFDEAEFNARIEDLEKKEKEERYYHSTRFPH